MKSASLKQYDIEQVIESQYPNLTKEESIQFVRTMFGTTVTENQIQAAYSFLGK